MINGNFDFGDETDPENIKKFAKNKLEELNEKFNEVLKASQACYAHHDFMSIMVSTENRAVVKFHKVPTQKEINILINALRVQMDLLKKEEQQNDNT